MSPASFRLLIRRPASRHHQLGRDCPHRPPKALCPSTALRSGQIRQNLDGAGFEAETGLPLLNLSVIQVLVQPVKGLPEIGL
jgi:hypothetical protein